MVINQIVHINRRGGTTLVLQIHRHKGCVGLSCSPGHIGGSEQGEANPYWQKSIGRPTSVMHCKLILWRDSEQGISCWGTNTCHMGARFRHWSLWRAHFSVGLYPISCLKKGYHILFTIAGRQDLWLIFGHMISLLQPYSPLSSQLAGINSQN